jgi:hypothetical protein
MRRAAPVQSLPFDRMQIARWLKPRRSVIAPGEYTLTAKSGNGREWGHRWICVPADTQRFLSLMVDLVIRHNVSDWRGRFKLNDVPVFFEFDLLTDSGDVARRSIADVEDGESDIAEWDEVPRTVLQATSRIPFSIGVNPLGWTKLRRWDHGPRLAMTGHRGRIGDRRCVERLRFRVCHLIECKLHDGYNPAVRSLLPGSTH